MYKNRLANYETYYKVTGGNYEVDTSRSVYEVFIELSRDKDGNVMKNKDGSDRYHAIDDALITTLDEDKLVIALHYIANHYLQIDNSNLKIDKDMELLIASIMAVLEDF